VLFSKAVTFLLVINIKTNTDVLIIVVVIFGNDHNQGKVKSAQLNARNLHQVGHVLLYDT
jgi:hypothetical protein